jgi:hypothetical protein
VIVLLIIMTGSCTKDPSPLFTNSVIKGNAALWGEWINDPSINVVARGPYGEISTLTEPGGSFGFSGLGNGTYSMEFSKEGYGTIKKYNFQLFGNDTIDVGFNYIFKKYNNFILPTLVDILIESAIPSGTIVTSKIPTASDPLVLPVVVYLGTDINVSYKNYSFICATTTTFSTKIDLNFDLRHVSFSKGTKVFLIAYAGNTEEVLNGYVDTFSGLQQISTLIPEKHSQVMSFIMP